MKTTRKCIISWLALVIGILPEAFSQKVKENNTSPADQVTICHLSGDYHLQTMTIPNAALESHLEHGDILGGCSPDNSPLKIFLNKTDVGCYGGSNGSVEMEIQFSKGHPAYNISWSNGVHSKDLYNLSAGVYSVTVSVGHGLSAFASISVDEPAPLTIDFRSKNISCTGKNDGEVVVIPSGGVLPYSFSWSHSADNFSNMAMHLGAGIYRVTVIDANGCLSIADINIEEPLPLTSNFISENVLCNGGNDGFISVNPRGGTTPYSFSWSSNAGNQSAGIANQLSKGNYFYTVTDANGCLTFSQADIYEPEPVKINFTVKNESCSTGRDGSASAIVSGGTEPYSYLWDSNAGSQVQASAINLPAGVYHLLVTDNNGCMKSESVSVIKDGCECMLGKEDCGATMVSLAQFIYCNPISGASNYQWEFAHKPSGFLKTIQRGYGLNNFHLTWVPGIQYGKTYEVRIRPFINGSWKDYGPVCTITVPDPIPFTKVRTADCGISTITLNQQLYCDFVPGAQNYQWEFSNSSLGFQKVVNRGSNSLSFTLAWVPGMQYGKTYDVRVRANVGGEWGYFGDVCQVSLIYPIPTTKVRSADCGITLVSMTQNIFCEAVAGATDYQWEISNAELSYFALYNRNSNNTSFQFALLSGVQFQTPYQVRVKAKVAGEWAEFGSICSITTPAAPLAPKEGNSKGENPELSLKTQATPSLNIYPNPSKGESISINLKDKGNFEKEITIEVYDILGNIIYSKKLLPVSGTDFLTVINKDGEFATGIYFLNVSSENNKYFERIVIK